MSFTIITFCPIFFTQKQFWRLASFLFCGDFLKLSPQPNTEFISWRQTEYINLQGVLSQICMSFRCSTGICGMFPLRGQIGLVSQTASRERYS